MQLVATRTRSIRGAVFGIAVSLVSYSCSPQKSSQQVEAPKFRLLATYDADSVKSVSYELAIEPCVKTQCPVVVHLVKGGMVIDSARLEWDSPSQETSQQETDARWGAGDPLGETPAPKAWASGEEATLMATVARPVQITSERTGLLVTQRGGWEHLKHRHDLFLNNGAKLSHEWSGSEGEGPTWSGTEIVRRADKKEEILFYSGLLSPEPQKPDSLSISRVAWDPQQGKITESPVGNTVPLQWVILGGYGNLERAQALRDRVDSCIKPMLWILDSGLYRGVPGKRFLGAVTARADLAPQVIEAAKHCTPPLEGKVVLYQESR